MDKAELDNAMNEFWKELSSRPRPEAQPAPKVTTTSMVMKPDEAAAYIRSAGIIQVERFTPNSNVQGNGNQ